MPIEGQYRGRVIMSGQVRSRRLLSSQMQSALGQLNANAPYGEVDSWVQAINDSVSSEPPPATFGIAVSAKPFGAVRVIREALRVEIEGIKAFNGGFLPRLKAIPVTGMRTPILVPEGVYEQSFEQSIEAAAQSGFGTVSTIVHQFRNPPARADARPVLRMDGTAMSGSERAVIGAISTLGSIMDGASEIALAGDDYGMAISVLTTISQVAAGLIGAAASIHPIAGIVVAVIAAVAAAIAVILEVGRRAFLTGRDIGWRSPWSGKERKLILMDRLRILAQCPDSIVDEVRAAADHDVEAWMDATGGRTPISKHDMSSRDVAAERSSKEDAAAALCQQLGGIEAAKSATMISEIGSWALYVGVPSERVEKYVKWMTKARKMTAAHARAIRYQGGPGDEHVRANKVGRSGVRMANAHWARGKWDILFNQELTHKIAGRHDWAPGPHPRQAGTFAWFRWRWGLDSVQAFSEGNLADVHNWLYMQIAPRSTGRTHGALVVAAPRAAGVTVEAMGFRCHARQGLNQNAVPAASRDAYTNAVAHGHPWGATCSRIGGASSATVTSPVGVYVSGSSGSKSAPLPFWGSKGGGMGGVGGPTTVSSSISSQDAAFIRTPEFQNALGQAIEGAVPAPPGRSVVPYVLGGVVLAGGIGIYFLSKK